MKINSTSRWYFPLFIFHFSFFISLFSSCLVDQDEVLYSAPETMGELTLRVHVPGLSLPSTRGLSTVEESAIETLDVLLFESDGTNETFFLHTTARKIQRDDTNEYTFSFSIVDSDDTKNYRFVLLANLEDEISGITFSTTDTKPQTLEKILFSPKDRWGDDKVSGTSPYLPMWGESATIHNITPSLTIPTISLLRAVSRINIGINMPASGDTPQGLGDTFYMETVEVRNVSESGLVAPSTVLLSGPTGTVIHTHTPIDNKGFINEIYLAETAKDKDISILIGGYYTPPGQTRNTTDKTWYKISLYDYNQPDPYSHPLDLLRNHYYRINITAIAGSGYTSADDALNNPSANLEFDLMVYEEKGDINHIVYNNHYLLGVEQTEYTLSGEKHEGVSLPVLTTYSGGWSYTITDSPEEGGNPVSWITVDDSKSTPLQSGKGRLTFDMDLGGIERTAYIHITAGSLSLVVTIVQEEDDNPLSGITLGTTLQYPLPTYVGAFWRNEQTGERLIRIPVVSGMEGPWLAMVMESTDAVPPASVIDPANTWIRLDDTISDDPDVWKEGVDPKDMYDNDNVYRLPDDAKTWVKGTSEIDGYIYFRIGLTGSISTGTEPRYGIVRLYYNDYIKYQDIYIRHGHEADYIMRPQDPTDDNTLQPDGQGIYRPLAKKFSPYNLTAQEFKDGSTADFIKLPQRLPVASPTSGGGVFTDYPSQAGALFKWAGPSGQERYAYNQVLTNRIESTSTLDFWDALKSVHETCPPGYRRANDGATNDLVISPDIVTSEMRQSLWRFDPQSTISGANLTNSVWGYLADGYFDRHNVVYSAVRPATSSVGYVGRLFYNVNNSASLFIPAAGFHDNNYLTSRGDGFCWSSTLASYSYTGSYLYVGQNAAGLPRLFRSNALSVRCVQE